MRGRRGAGCRLAAGFSSGPQPPAGSLRCLYRSHPTITCCLFLEVLHIHILFPTLRPSCILHAKPQAPANTQLSGSSRAGLFGSPPCSLICLCGSVMPSVTWVRAQLEYPHPFPLYVIRQSNLALRPANRFKRKKNLPTSSLALFSHFYQFFSGTVLGLK